MDASASPKANADINEVYGLLLTAIKNNNFSMPINQRSTFIKYTKLPDFDIQSNVSWLPQNNALRPRIRRIVTLDDAGLRTNRSLKPEFFKPISIVASTCTTPNFAKRKIVTISEDDENDLHPKFTNEKKQTPKTANRSVGVDFREEKQSHRTTSRLSNSLKYSKEAKTSGKINNAYKKEVNEKPNHRSKQISKPPGENIKIRYMKSKEIVRQTKPSSVTSRSSLSRNLTTPSKSEKDLPLLKNKLNKNLKYNDLHKNAEKTKQTPSPPLAKNKMLHFKEIQNKNLPLTVIRVPLDNKYKKLNEEENKIPINTLEPLVLEPNKTDRGADTDEFVDFKNVNIGTDPLPKTVDQVTDMDDFEISENFNSIESTVQMQSNKETFDRLEIPNVTLIKDNAEYKDNSLNKCDSLPNLNVPALKLSPHSDGFKPTNIGFCENTSYIISRATLTYTTRQKINFHVVGSNDYTSSNQSPSQLVYPMNVVSVFKNDYTKEKKSLNVADDSEEKKSACNANYTKCLNELNSLNSSYVFNNNKLIKPSDIISTISINNGLLQSDYICEQFQRELNFIDSFFESLQYLESCSLSNKCFADDKVEKLVHKSALFDSSYNVKNSEYNNFLSTIENVESIDDAETMASKSLCLLNLLIRDEQRRAKNLLFVLKMREDALKDFTRSQILWLEKKKKHENTDISTLKKKQRGALLKLQHECGEMQRMRKALLTLSEKRKFALMKTKKNIELKLKNNIHVEQIIFEKKKLKRNSTPDRNIAPLKCFDLSSSSCEDSTSSKLNSAVVIVPPQAPVIHTSATRAEKYVQTGDSILGTLLMDQATSTAAENFIVVDGGYLNILFHNLMLPQIFSNGKQYEVNEEALKNIVNSANRNNFNGCEMVEKLMEQIKNRDLDRSSSPSTARSLVDEFDQYYKGLADDDNISADSPERNSPQKVPDYKDIFAQVPDSVKSDMCHRSTSLTRRCVDDITVRSCGCDPLIHTECECQTEKILVMASSQTQTGPLPVPVGAAATPDTTPPDIPVWSPPLLKSSESSTSEESVSSQPLYGSISSISSPIASPVHCEAEELRRQQLAIEMEIKALEQQQCQLLVVREIPDKPPPPYTPPAEPRLCKQPRKFTLDDTAVEKIDKHITSPENVAFDPTDPFDVFLKDFCQETLEKHNKEQSDEPWDACNLLPQKTQADNEKLTEKTSIELQEILTGAIPAVASGFSSRRSDHIDDILFAEWRRCEPEWTTLHTDEAIVKNQLFESIFQKILSETIDEYRRTVQCKADTE